MESTTVSRRGTLKIFLGYAAGVGKTYQMLKEAQQLKKSGVDVVVGYFEPHGRKDTIDLMEDLEVVPRRIVVYRGTTFEDMDTDAILMRRPAVCAVDEFAHTNVPMSTREKRWEDVEVLLDAGINVLTTMNVQHLESLYDSVLGFTGVRVRETVPDWVVESADEVVLVDLTIEALMNRLVRGQIYAPAKAKQALEGFFQEPALRVLRELAMRQTAHELDVHKEPQDGGEEAIAASRSDANEAEGTTRTSDRILIYVNADPATAMLIRRGRRVADYLRADCFAVAVESAEARRAPTPAQRDSLEKHLDFARHLRIETRVVHAGPVAEALVSFARLHQVTQIFIARAQQGSYIPVLGQSLVQQVVRLARDMQVTIVAERRR